MVADVSRTFPSQSTQEGESGWFHLIGNIRISGAQNSILVAAPPSRAPHKHAFDSGLIISSVRGAEFYPPGLLFFRSSVLLFFSLGFYVRCFVCSSVCNFLYSIIYFYAFVLCSAVSNSFNNHPQSQSKIQTVTQGHKHKVQSQTYKPPVYTVLVSKNPDLDPRQNTRQNRSSSRGGPPFRTRHTNRDKRYKIRSTTITINAVGVVVQFQDVFIDSVTKWRWTAGRAKAGDATE